jgi:DNA-directed RNA polymerase sigma subunit (sigma70/sigma32)
VFNNVLNKLDDVERDIITLSFGLNDGVSRTNEDIAGYLHLASDKVRSIKFKTIEKLKDNKELRSLLIP